jgi:hypothetical protein
MAQCPLCGTGNQGRRLIFNVSSFAWRFRSGPHLALCRPAASLPTRCRDHGPWGARLGTGSDGRRGRAGQRQGAPDRDRCRHRRFSLCDRGALENWSPPPAVASRWAAIAPFRAAKRATPALAALADLKDEPVQGRGSSAPALISAPGPPERRAGEPARGLLAGALLAPPLLAPPLLRLIGQAAERAGANPLPPARPSRRVAPSPRPRHGRRSARKAATPTH